MTSVPDLDAISTKEFESFLASIATQTGPTEWQALLSADLSAQNDFLKANPQNQNMAAFLDVQPMNTILPYQGAENLLFSSTSSLETPSWNETEFYENLSNPDSLSSSIPTSPHSEDLLSQIQSTNDNNSNDDLLLQEIVSRIEWNAEDNNAKSNTKRRREHISKEIQQEKHKSAEKQRRDNMNEVIDRLKLLLPPSKETKVTKITVLQETVEYVSKVQELCKQLIQENKELKNKLASSTTTTTAVTSSMTSTTTGVDLNNKSYITSKQQEPVSKRARLTDTSRAGISKLFPTLLDGSRAIFLGVFFLVTVFNPLETVFNSNTNDQQWTAASSGRTMLETTNSTENPYSFEGAMCWAEGMAHFYCKWLMFILVSFVTISWGEFMLPSNSPLLEQAERECEIGKNRFASGDFPHEVGPHFSAALKLLGKSPDHSTPVLILLTAYQVFRYITHRLRFGLYIERFIHRMRGGDKRYAILLTETASTYIKHSKITSLEILYILFSAVNLAEIYDLQHQLLALKLGLTFRSHITRGVLAHLLEVYIEHGLTNLSTDPNHISNECFEQKSSLFSSSGVKLFMNGNSKPAKVLLTQALEASLKLPSERHVFNMPRIASILGIVAMWEGRYEESAQIFAKVTKLSIDLKHRIGECWGSVGLANALVMTNQLKEARFTFDYYSQHFRTGHLSEGLTSGVEEFIYQIGLLMYWIKMGDFQKAMEIMDSLKPAEVFQEILFYGAPFYSAYYDASFLLWEESMKETSSIHTHSTKLARATHSIGRQFSRASCNLAMLRTRAVIFKGRYYYLMGNYHKAKAFLQAGVSLAEKKESSYELELAREALERGASQFVDQKDYCFLHTMITKRFCTS